jgi:hypothetical protein
VDHRDLSKEPRHCVILVQVVALVQCSADRGNVVERVIAGVLMCVCGEKDSLLYFKGRYLQVRERDKERESFN